MVLCYGSLNRQIVFPQTHMQTHTDTLSHTKITHPHEAHTDSHTQTLTPAPSHTLIFHPHSNYTTLVPFTQCLTHSHILPKARDSGCGSDFGSDPHQGRFPSLNGGLCSLSGSLVSPQMHPEPFACTPDFLHSDPGHKPSVPTLAWIRSWEA